MDDYPHESRADARKCHGKKRRFRGKKWRSEGGPPMFAMKRPLRFLVHKLDLDEDQAIKVADAMNDFRIEKAQFEVDRSRAKKTLLAALKSPEFDDEKAAEAIEASAEAVRKLQSAFTEALRKIHGELTETQREKLAVLLASIGFDF